MNYQLPGGFLKLLHLSIVIMPENKKLKNSHWTEQHDAFCLENKLTPSAQLLWRYLIEGEGNEQEPDLLEFNDWVAKHRGKGYSRPTLKTALAQLVECRVVQLVKKFTWRIVRIVTRPLEWLKPRKNLQKRTKTFNSQPSNPQSAENEVNSSSISSNHPGDKQEILAVCAEAGIHYHPDKPAKVFSYSLEEILLAIQVFKNRSITERIHNPPGWLIECLQWRYWEDVVLAWGEL